MARTDIHRATQSPAALTDLQFLRAADVCALLRISRPTLWRMRRCNEFPLPTALSRRSIGWRRLEVEAWLESRAASRSPLARPAAPVDVAPRQSTPSATPPVVPPPAARPKRVRRQLPLSFS